MEKEDPSVPINTYIAWEEGIARIKWYLKSKRPKLDKIVRNYNPGHNEREFFYYSDPRVISDLFGHVLESKKYSGIRIYFGSCLDVIPAGCDPGDKGKLVLIYVPTTNEKDDSAEAMDENIKPFKDSDKYYKLRPSDCSRVRLTSEVFDDLVLNYENKKRGVLRRSLSATDRKNPKTNKETKHLFMNRECIREIKTEIDYQLDMSAKYGATGIKVYITSYTNKPVQRDGYELSRRLTIQFVFTDDAGQDLNLERIDPRYSSRPHAIALNTINPTPPYP
jgi:hypothetical protein